MKKAKLGFLVLTSVVGVTAALMGACSSEGSSSSDPNQTGNAGEGGSGSGGASSNAGQGGSNADKCEDVTCENDDNPCTEDICNPATGKCGVPRSGTSCNDGLYCNGADKCEDGKCTDHAGSPCAAGQACNEADNRCECNDDTDCPEVEYGEWSTPMFETVCDETGTKHRTVTTYTCEQGMCADTVTTEDGSDTRLTDGEDCPDDDLLCNGDTSKCSGGTCEPTNVNPCTGQSATPYCYEITDNYSCRACKDNGAGQDPGCTSSAPNCCSGTCKTSCFVIDPDIIINPDIVIDPQLVIDP